MSFLFQIISEDSDKPFALFSVDQQDEADRVCKLLNTLSGEEEYFVDKLLIDDYVGAQIATQYYVTAYPSLHNRLVHIWKVEIPNNSVALYLSEMTHVFPLSIINKGFDFVGDLESNIAPLMGASFDKQEAIAKILELIPEKYGVVRIENTTKPGKDFQMSIVEVLR